MPWHADSNDGNAPRKQDQFLRDQASLALVETTLDDIICKGGGIAVLPSYQVCNGWSNQLLGHTAYISRIIEEPNTKEVRIPDAFIINGVQTEPDGEVFKNVFATQENSVPLSSVIDIRHLLDTIRDHSGVNNVCLVPHETVIWLPPPEDNCNWLGNLAESNDDLALELLTSIIKPSTRLSQLLINNVSNNLKSRLQSSKLSLSDGICLHHRNGTDWHQHCKMWAGNNCLESDGMPLGSLVHARIPTGYPKKWVYYIGDEEPGESLARDFEQYNLQLLHRGKHNLLDDDSLQQFLANVGAPPSRTEEGPFRDISAAIDFFVCKLLDSFVGNSVSTFSMLQIDVRRGKNSTWYNSRGLPLDSFLKVHHPPLVYTHSELLSDPLRKSTMKESILSSQKVLGLGAEIHVIYHGSNDGEFLSWLKDRSVTVHPHEPKWVPDIIDKLKQRGDSVQSDLSTWQRIDIPLFINSEYAIFMEANMAVNRPFTIADLGLDITRGIAFSDKSIGTEPMPQNSGVMLINVPRLRQSYDNFISFITEHATEGKDFVMGSSAQGAYLDFYGQANEGSPTTGDFYERVKMETSQVRFFDFDAIL
ncbi:hypothetical protein ACHAXR_006470 [Thalassiosira sp. AJA248-18]